MKDQLLAKTLFICLFVCLLAQSAIAYWDNPILLSELNDDVNNYAAYYPMISADENTLLFSRNYPGNVASLWQAERNPQTGVFDQQRRLTELKHNGKLIYGSWLSEDKLRLYYATSEYGTSGRPIWMAQRTSVNDTWQTVKRFQELEIEVWQTACSLTADEKVIMYETADFGTGGLKRIFTASRDSSDSSFTVFQEMYELEAIEAWVPQMSPDGLTVYFNIKNDEGYFEAWMGTRESLNDIFSDFIPLEDINALTDTNTNTPFPSWDGQKLYFKQRQGVLGDLNAMGIFVVEWVDPPEVVVDKNLVAAIEEKNAILEQLTATIEKEIETLEILDMLQELTRRGSDEYRAIQKTKISISKALRDEILAQSKIRSSIRELETSLSQYRMEQ